MNALTPQDKLAPVSNARRNWLKAAGALAGLSLMAGPAGLVMAAW